MEDKADIVAPDLLQLGLGGSDHLIAVIVTDSDTLAFVPRSCTVESAVTDLPDPTHSPERLFRLWQRGIDAFDCPDALKATFRFDSRTFIRLPEVWSSQQDQVHHGAAGHEHFAGQTRRARPQR